MTHEPVSLFIAWMKTQPAITALTPRIASTHDADTPLPAVSVPQAVGGPANDASGMDVVYDWTLNVYCIAGKTGLNNAYPDSQLANQIAGTILNAMRSLTFASPYVTPQGAVIVDAAVETLTRGTDDAGNAVVTMTVALRVAE